MLCTVKVRYAPWAFGSFSPLAVGWVVRLLPRKDPKLEKERVVK